jgi:imidazolonepropionase
MTTLYKNIRQIWSQSKVQENVSVVVEDQKIKKIGDYNALVKKFSKAKTVDCSSEVWFPAFSECHTHLVYGGSRQKDFALRMTGKTYAEVAALGGGILSTIKPTRELSLGILYEKALIDLQTFEKQGVGALEIKSGYGLTLESELKILKVIQKLKKDPNIKIVSTFMPAHAIPPEFKGKAEDFVDVITKEWIPEVARQKLADFFDVFIEDGYFNVKQAAKMCKKAKDLGLKIKLHVDQFKDIGGVDFGIDIGAVSLDHLESISDSNIKKLAKTDIVAVLAPGASLFTKTPYAPARKMLDAGVKVALTSDYNPGTCPSKNLLLMTTIACTQMGMSVDESLMGITDNAARALGLEKEFGIIEEGRAFKVARFTMPSYEYLPYSFGDI